MRSRVVIFLVGMGILLSFPKWSEAQWKQTSGLGGGQINAFAVSGTNLFSGTAHGVFLSTNNGKSWTAVNSGLPEWPNVQCLAVSGTNIFAGTDESGVFLSTNNGKSWTAVNSGLPEKTGVRCLTVSGSYLFVGTDGRGVWRLPLSDVSIETR